jgi:nucleotide-binding universal stress UspA family protein
MTHPWPDFTRFSVAQRVRGTAIATTEGEVIAMKTGRIERILCATDFSSFSNQALRHALALTRQFEARLKVVYVIPHVFPGGESMYGAAPWLMTPEVRERADEDLRRFLEPAREARITHELEVREGEPWREIVDAAEEMEADLVVIGAHGRGGFDRYILGSVAEKLVRRLPCSVLTVSHEEGHTWAAPGLITRILCATDFSETSTEALRLASLFASGSHAAITVLNTVENTLDFGDPTYLSMADLGPVKQEMERASIEKLRAAIAAMVQDGIAAEPHVVSGRAFKEILRASVAERADLIVIGAQGHGFLEHMLAGSNAQHVIRGATCPVLTVRAKKASSRRGDEPHGLTLAATDTGLRSDPGPRPPKFQEKGVNP